MKENCAEQKIQWTFIASFAPWQGGVYERMVGLTKVAMRRAVGWKILTDEALNTLLTECESIVNERPLTYVGDDSTDVLRPVDFLIPKAKAQIERIETDREDDEEYRPGKKESHEQLLKRWKGTLKCLDKLWRFWQEGYLDMLRERNQVKHRGQRSVTKREPRKEEIVLLKEEELPRGEWRMGRIVGLPKSKDNAVRIAEVQISTRRIIRRPINLLIPLEVEENRKKSLTGDPNLEEESAETDDEAKPNRAAVVVEKKSSRTSIKLFTVMLIAVLAGVYGSPAVGNKEFQLCNVKRSGILMMLPEPITCAHSKEDQMITSQATIYVRDFAKITAHHCSKVTRTVCTKAFAKFSLQVTSDSTKQEGVTQKSCEKMGTYKTAGGFQLIPVSSHRARTANPVQYSYGWFGTRCTPTVNFVWEEGEVATTDFHHIFSNLAPTDGCNPEEGSCPHKNGILIWNLTEWQKSCPYKKIGAHEVHVKGQHVLVDDMQAAFVLEGISEDSSADNQTDSCNFKNARIMENGVVVELRPKSKLLQGNKMEKAGLMEGDGGSSSDPENVRFQYLYDSLKGEIDKVKRREYIKICTVQRASMQTIRWISKHDPTEAARTLLDREDVIAENVGEFLKIVPCQKIIADEVYENYEVKGKCFDKLPIRIGNEVVFVGRRSKDLNEHATEVSCELKKWKGMKVHRLPSIRDQELTEKEKKVEFTGNVLMNWEKGKLKMAIAMVMEMQNRRMERPKVNETKKGVIDQLRDEAEDALVETKKELEKAAEEVINELTAVVEHWKLMGGGIISAFLIVLTAVVCFKCMLWRLFKKCKRSNRRERHSHRGEQTAKANISIPEQELPTDEVMSIETSPQRVRYVPVKIPRAAKEKIASKGERYGGIRGEAHQASAREAEEEG